MTAKTIQTQTASLSVAREAAKVFAQKRFCSTEGIENVIPLSVFRNPEFAKAYGLLQTEGNGRGLLARAVVVIDETGKIMYTQLVNEVSEEPDYQDVMDALK